MTYNGYVNEGTFAQGRIIRWYSWEDPETGFRDTQSEMAFKKNAWAWDKPDLYLWASHYEASFDEWWVRTPEQQSRTYRYSHSVDMGTGRVLKGCGF